MNLVGGRTEAAGDEMNARVEKIVVMAGNTLKEKQTVDEYCFPIFNLLVQEGKKKITNNLYTFTPRAHTAFKHFSSLQHWIIWWHDSVWLTLV